MLVPKRWLHGLIAVALLFVMGGLLIATASAVTPESPSDRSIIAFRATVPDAAVQEFIETKGLQVEAVYLWNTGFSGTYRTYIGRTAGELLDHARQQSLSLFANGMRSNANAAGAFLSATNAGADSYLTSARVAEARSILNNAAQVRLALEHARTGDAHVYAIEAIDASQAQLDDLLSDPLVSSVAPKTGPQTAGLLKPAAYHAEWRDPSIAALSPRDIFARIRLTSTISGED